MQIYWSVSQPGKVGMLVGEKAGVGRQLWWSINQPGQVGTFVSQ